MNLETYLNSIKDLPLPTDEQFDRFAAHVAVAHSWYKHLDLFRGADVIVFLDPQAGGKYDADRERLHHTWKTRNQYLDLFGHLSYMYHVPHMGEGQFTTDYSEISAEDMPRELREQCGFLMYPFACDNHVLAWRFEEEFKAMEAGRLDHPCRDLLVRFYRSGETLEEAFPFLEPECNRLYAAGEKARRPDLWTNWSDVSARERYFEEQKSYLYRTTLEDAQAPAHGLTEIEQEFVRRIRDRFAAWETLEEHEAAKIRTALQNLKRILKQAGLSPVTPLSYFIRGSQDEEEKRLDLMAQSVAEIVLNPSERAAMDELEKATGGFLKLDRWYDGDSLRFHLRYGFEDNEAHRINESIAQETLELIVGSYSRLKETLRERLLNRPGITYDNESTRDHDEIEIVRWLIGDDLELRFQYRFHCLVLEYDKARDSYSRPFSVPFDSFVGTFQIFGQLRERSSPDTEFRAVYIRYRNLERSARLLGHDRCERVIYENWQNMAQQVPESIVMRSAYDTLLVLDCDTDRSEFLNTMSRYADEHLYIKIRGMDVYGRFGQRKDLLTSEVIVVEGTFEELPDLSHALRALDQLAAIEPVGSFRRRMLVTRFKHHAL